MPNFSSLAQSLKKSYLRAAIFSAVVLAIIIASLQHEPKLALSSPVVQSQDISLITKLVTKRSELEYLLLAQPLSDFPRYVIKYKDQPQILVVKVPSTSHMNLEREVLLKNDIPYGIAQPEWLLSHKEVLQDPSTQNDFWQSTGSFLARNAIGLLLLVFMLFALKKGLPSLGFALDHAD